MFIQSSLLRDARVVTLEDLIVLGVPERCVSEFVDEFDPLFPHHAENDGLVLI